MLSKALCSTGRVRLFAAEHAAGDSTNGAMLQKLAAQLKQGDIAVVVGIERFTRLLRLLQQLIDSALEVGAMIIVLIPPPALWTGALSSDPREVLEALCCGKMGASVAEHAVRELCKQHGRDVRNVLTDLVSDTMAWRDECPGAGALPIWPLVLCNGSQVTVTMILLKLFKQSHYC